MLNPFTPSWTRVWTSQAAEAELTGFKFSGPGWYHTKTDSMLVIPLNTDEQEAWWESSEDPEALYIFNIYNGHDPTKIFLWIANATVRERRV